ncbi:MAG: hypothetical protein V4764_17615 [Burkholderia sp.]
MRFVFSAQVSQLACQVRPYLEKVLSGQGVAQLKQNLLPLLQKARKPVKFADSRDMCIGKNDVARAGAALATRRKALRGLRAAEIGRVARKAPKIGETVPRGARFPPISLQGRKIVRSVLFFTKRRDGL